MMYVINRNGICLLYREWNRPLRTLNFQQDHKLMFGLLFSLKSFTTKMDPTRVPVLIKGTLGCLNYLVKDVHFIVSEQIKFQGNSSWDEGGICRQESSLLSRDSN